MQDFHAALLQPITAKATAQAGIKGLMRAYIQWVLQHPDQARLLHALRRESVPVEGFGVRKQ